MAIVPCTELHAKSVSPSHLMDWQVAIAVGDLVKIPSSSTLCAFMFRGLVITGYWSSEILDAAVIILEKSFIIS